MRAAPRGLIGNQRETLDIPRKVVHGAGRCQDHRAARSKCQTNQALPSHLERSLGGARELDYASFARDRSGGVQVAVDVKGQSLWAPQPAVES